MTDTDPKNDPLYDAAYAAVDEGRLDEAVALFGQLIEREPDNPAFRYMQGLAHKYRFDWPASLACNLKAIELYGKDAEDDAALWNAAIAATGAGDWATARRCWKEAGIRIPGKQGPIEGDYGPCCLRLNPWGEGETLWAERLDPCRARIGNVPLPESGYRFGDVVLHDGANTGFRHAGGRRFLVFNVFQRLEKSAFDTFDVELTCETEADVEALLEAEAKGIGRIEDWTASLQVLCRACSLGEPHEHGPGEEPAAWKPERALGIAATSHEAVKRLLDDWVAAGPGRRVDNVFVADAEPAGPEGGAAWWRGSEDEEDDD